MFTDATSLTPLSLNFSITINTPVRYTMIYLVSLVIGPMFKPLGVTVLSPFILSQSHAIQIMYPTDTLGNRFRKVLQITQGNTESNWLNWDSGPSPSGSRFFPMSFSASMGFLL